MGGEPAGGAPADPQRRLAETGAAIVAGVEARAPAWIAAQVARIADAWGRLDDATRTRLDAQVPSVAAEATARVVAELRALVALHPVEQRRTPLEIVRTIVREPAALLRDAGIPPVARDPFDQRAAPDDAYDLAPRTLGDLGDPDLAPLHLAWGVAKAATLRAGGDDA